MRDTPYTFADHVYFLNSRLRKTGYSILTDNYIKCRWKEPVTKLQVVSVFLTDERVDECRAQSSHQRSRKMVTMSTNLLDRRERVCCLHSEYEKVLEYNAHYEVPWKWHLKQLLTYYAFNSLLSEQEHVGYYAVEQWKPLKLTASQCIIN